MYVGDNLNRDVIGTREANFGMVIILLDETDADKEVDEQTKPDLVIHALNDLLDIFPPRKGFGRRLRIDL